MAKVSKDAENNLERITDTIRDAYLRFQPNIDRYHFMKNFVFNTALSGEDKQKLEVLEKPPIESNVLEAYISRLRGEFAEQTPSFKTQSATGEPINIETIELVEAHLLNILQEANGDDFSNQTYMDTLGGGFSAWKIWTEYRDNHSYDLSIRLGRVFEPTLTIWDPMARLPHKGDGRFAGELYPMLAKDVKRDYPQADIENVRYTMGDGFDWAYRTTDDLKVLLLCDYYEIKNKRTQLFLLADGTTMREKEYNKLIQFMDENMMLVQPPKIIKKRWVDDRYVKRYLLLGHQMLEDEDTDFEDLPYIFVDGNSVLLKEGKNGQFLQMTRPYVYHSLGVQKFKNMALQSYAAAIENQNQTNITVPIEGIPEGYEDEYTKPQIPHNLLYKTFTIDDNGERVPLSPPAPFPKVPMPQEVAMAYESAEKTIQNILGSYDASLGINNNQLSGEAIFQGAIQSNAAALPYNNNYLYALGQAAKVMVNVMPKVFETPRTIPIVLPDGSHGYRPINQNPNQKTFGFKSNALNVKVSAAANFKIQQQRAFLTLTQLIKNYPALQAFFNEAPGAMKILLSNVDIKDIDKVKEMFGKYQEQKQQQAQAAQQAQQNMPNPLQLKQEELALKAQGQQQDFMARQAQLDVERDRQKHDMTKEVIELLMAIMKQNEKLTEQETKRIDEAIRLYLNSMDMGHQHAKDKHDASLKLNDQLQSILNSLGARVS